MRYLLDTCTVSDFVRGEPGVLTRVKATPPSLLSVSVLTRMEIDYGLALNPERAARITPMLSEFFRLVTTLPFEAADSRATASLRAALKMAGRPIGAYDALIAGSALARGLVVITSNLGEFGRVGGLQVEDWRQVNI